MGRFWFLEGVAADGSHVTHEISVAPFRVGRDATNELALVAPGLSRRHAELVRGDGDGLRLMDLGSTNGTYVNRTRVEGSCVLAENDIIHFGNAEFRLGVHAGATQPQEAPERTMIVAAGSALSGHFVPHERQFSELLGGRGISGAVQPIVQAATGERFAYELLGRSTHPELPASPMHLFALAARLGREADLSRAFREHGVRKVALRAPGSTLFVNTHPEETFREDFLKALAKLPSQGVALDLVIEVHETAVMEIERMRELAAQLKDIGVRFAYDDFGAGQARLNELSEVPAHFVKFDMGLVRGLNDAGPGKQKMVAELVRLVRELGSVPLAEGIEAEADAVVCRQMSFELIQGYLTGRPVQIESI